MFYCLTRSSSCKSTLIYPLHEFVELFSLYVLYYTEKCTNLADFLPLSLVHGFGKYSASSLVFFAS